MGFQRKHRCQDAQQSIKANAIFSLKFCILIIDCGFSKVQKSIGQKLFHKENVIGMAAYKGTERSRGEEGNNKEKPGWRIASSSGQHISSISTVYRMSKI